MPKTKISEFSATPGNNTDIDGINIAEGCAPSGINDAIRELMAQLKDFQAGTAGDSFNGPVGTSTAAAGAFTTLSASSTVSGTGFSTYLASPPAIGGTTAAAGSFTTLSASGNITISGGTANGVAYLNGSKVLTTGSALTFDGTSLLQATGGAAAVFRAGSTISSGRAATINLGNNAGVARATIALDAGTELMTIGSEGNFPVMFQVNGSEGARLTSTGLGIGTSSPAYKLSVNSGATTTIGLFTSTGSAAFLGLANSGATTYIGNDSTSGSFIIQTPSGGFSTKLTLDNTGNLGLGVTPSAWSTGKALELGFLGNALWGNAADEVIVSQNAYFNFGWKYATSRKATHYSQYDAQHRWFTAPSGTAGNAISWTQAMTLDASGNLGVGTTSPRNVAGYKNIAIDGSTSGLLEINTNGTRVFSLYGAGNDINLVNPTATGTMQFYTNNTERARIDSSGNFFVGTTSGLSGQLRVFNGISARATDNYNAAPNIRFWTGVDTTGGIYCDFYNSAGTTIGTITRSGTSTVAYNTSSDYRLKEDVQPMTGALAKVAALKPCTYKWKADGSEGEGFIAHELAEVVPQCVTGEKDAVNAEGKPKYQGVDTSFLVATLTAAIQEQQALIQQLQADVAALKAR